jgi:hypothetical protein
MPLELKAADRKLRLEESEMPVLSGEASVFKMVTNKRKKI